VIAAPMARTKSSGLLGSTIRPSSPSSGASRVRRPSCRDRNAAGHGLDGRDADLPRLGITYTSARL
jgi:hypothetical protein